MEYYPAIKKDEVRPFAATWMDLESVILSEASQTRRRGEISYDIPYMWNQKRNDTNELTKQKETNLENELMVADGKGYLGSLDGRVHTAIF